MPRRFRSPWWLLVLPLVAALGACAEDLETGATCPVLCPGQELVIRDTVLDAVITLDTALAGFPIQGSEEGALLAWRPDTLDTRFVVRFDSLQRRYQRAGFDTLLVVARVDSAAVTVVLGRTEIPIPTAWQLEAYDVWDSTLVDTIPEAVLPRFEPGRLLGVYNGTTFVTDTLRVQVPIDSAYLRDVLATPNRRLRVGFRLRAAESVQFTVRTTEQNLGATIDYDIIHADTIWIETDPQGPTSETPDRPPVVASDLVDYAVTALAPNEAAAGQLHVGGMPAARSYLRFSLPLWLTDSVTVLRAQLEFLKVPTVGVSASDSLRLDVHMVLANATVPELRRSATLISPPNSFSPSQTVITSASDTLRIEFGSFIRYWNTANTARPVPSAMVLRSALEGSAPAALRVHGSDAADPALRPRLRISYTAGSNFGRP